MPQNGGKPCDERLSRNQRCKDLPPCPPVQDNRNVETSTETRLAARGEKHSGSRMQDSRTSSTTAGSSMMDDEDDSKFAKLRGYILNVSEPENGEPITDRELLGSMSFHVKDGRVYASL